MVVIAVGMLEFAIPVLVVTVGFVEELMDADRLVMDLSVAVELLKVVELDTLVDTPELRNPVTDVEVEKLVGAREVADDEDVLGEFLELPSDANKLDEVDVTELLVEMVESPLLADSLPKRVDVEVDVPDTERTFEVV